MKSQTTNNSKITKNIHVSEAAIEDVFATYPQILADVLGISGDLQLIARQKQVASGRIDLLYVLKSRLLLIELKIEGYYSRFLTQVSGYRSDLIKLQESDELVSGEIETFLLTTGFGTNDLKDCQNAKVNLISYEPSVVLATFYERMAGLSNFLTIKPKDYGIWNIHVINRVLYLLPEYNTVPALTKVMEKNSANTLRNHLQFASQLGLVHRFKDKYLLTDLGLKFVKLRDEKLSQLTVSEPQIELIREHIVKDPFASNVIFGIYSLVESVFILSRNSYPVDINFVITYFRESVGKRYDWDTTRSAFLGAHAFTNFGVELGLLAKAGDNILLTPAGFRFILMLQLHKGIKIVDSLGLGT